MVSPANINKLNNLNYNKENNSKMPKEMNKISPIHHNSNLQKFLDIQKNLKKEQEESNLNTLITKKEISNQSLKKIKKNNEKEKDRANTSIKKIDRIKSTKKGNSDLKIIKTNLFKNKAEREKDKDKEKENTVHESSKKLSENELFIVDFEGNLHTKAQNIRGEFDESINKSVKDYIHTMNENDVVLDKDNLVDSENLESVKDFVLERHHQFQNFLERKKEIENEKKEEIAEEKDKEVREVKKQAKSKKKKLNGFFCCF